ncbi:hypothetical protein FOZ61_010873 [Perkinsus olseni]|uniref:Peptidase A1 domain-containing protein n=1 Tax=Perkinsus olseni TaxID=32597 RepID=A0A7J6M301_PEROL|nr:hypothetical protein FOZ61_010873 [Perkinsus olseni]
MMKAAVLLSAGAWRLIAASSSLSFPMQHNRAEMNFDGYPLKLAVDSGSAESYLVYGGWYESLYGPGSCEHLVTGCYFCPSTDPCDLDSLRTQETHKLKFISGCSVDIVARNVTLIVGEKQFRNFQIGLMVGNNGLDRCVQPYALLGLSITPANTTTERLPSTLQQLVKAGGISETAFSIHVSKLYVGISGSLVLGREPHNSTSMISFPLVRPRWARQAFAIAASVVRVKSPSTTDQVIDLSGRQANLEVVVDTGTARTKLPTEVFSMILLAAITAEFGFNHVRWSESTHQLQEAELLSYSDKHGHIWVRKNLLGQLPIVVVEVGAESSFEVNLSNHAQICENDWCVLLLTNQIRFLGPSHIFVLGQSFFMDYNLHVNFDDNVIRLATPQGPVEKQVVSKQSWTEILNPRCKRTF